MACASGRDEQADRTTRRGTVIGVEEPLQRSRVHRVTTAAVVRDQHQALAPAMPAEVHDGRARLLKKINQVVGARRAVCLEPQATGVPRLLDVVADLAHLLGQFQRDAARAAEAGIGGEEEDFDFSHDGLRRTPVPQYGSVGQELPKSHVGWRHSGWNAAGDSSRQAAESGTTGWALRRLRSQQLDGMSNPYVRRRGRGGSHARPSRSRSRPCGSGLATSCRTRNGLRPVISGQSRSGGGGGMQKSGYDAWQRCAAGAGECADAAAAVSPRMTSVGMTMRIDRGGRARGRNAAWDRPARDAAQIAPLRYHSGQHVAPQ